MDTVKPPSANEGIKANSRFLRGSIADGLLQVETGALSDDDQQLTKFHVTATGFRRSWIWKTVKETGNMPRRLSTDRWSTRRRR